MLQLLNVKLYYYYYYKCINRRKTEEKIKVEHWQKSVISGMKTEVFVMAFIQFRATVRQKKTDRKEPIVYEVVITLVYMIYLHTF